mmetsp:Transcript_9097/g.16795  ORF Transcript_9097/g.16795 Transcript_9097/m.16795 type:complete len:296 (+) Transcript_9097:543-1430(+)
MWRYEPSAGSTERGKSLQLRGLVAIVNKQENPWRIEAEVQGESSTYFVFGRVVDSERIFCCSCPDSRSGYCKHAAAVLCQLKHANQGNNKSAGPSWLAAAYSSAPVNTEKPTEASLEARTWASQLRLQEHKLNSLDRAGCLDLLVNVLESSESESQAAISRMFGGVGSQSESYQGMAVTRYMDTLARLRREPKERLVWCLLYLLYDSKSQLLFKLVRDLSPESSKSSNKTNDSMGNTSGKKVEAADSLPDLVQVESGENSQETTSSPSLKRGGSEVEESSKKRGKTADVAIEIDS